MSIRPAHTDGLTSVLQDFERPFTRGSSRTTPPYSGDQLFEQEGTEETEVALSLFPLYAPVEVLLPAPVGRAPSLFPFIAEVAILSSYGIIAGLTGKEPAMGARRIRREQRREDMAESRHRNGIRKAAERERRDARMVETVRAGKLPFTPPVMSWLSSKIGKRSSLISQEEVNTLVSGSAK
jgi:hypothetical protein